ncbi:hypothetical protein NL676_019515 [Syzygium grande]|nr:hypothetical protein NL676_019515 [Syzygium grande]
MSESQLNHTIPHPHVRYIHTPLSISDNELLAMIGGENSVDLITVAEAIHWFDLPKFYSLVNRVLRKHLFDHYKTLPFPFESVGLGSEGNPMALDIPKEVSFNGILGILTLWSTVTTAKERAVEMLSEAVVREFERVWGGTKLARNVVYKAFILAGKVKK